jgi:hypothetical protein
MLRDHYQSCNRKNRPGLLVGQATNKVPILDKHEKAICATAESIESLAQWWEVTAANPLRFDRVCCALQNMNLSGNRWFAYVCQSDHTVNMADFRRKSSVVHNGKQRSKTAEADIPQTLRSSKPAL